MLCYKTSTCFLLFLLSVQLTHAQTYPFARLTGSPQMDTRGWNLAGDAHIGDTDGDGDSFSNELILCNPTNFNSGACFFNQPVNISQCQKWAAEFDYRMWEGTAADGIAFCFLANPPIGFVVGGNIGIPSRPKGLMVFLDTWLNCEGSTPVPKLEIRYADGSISYGSGTEAVLECPTPAQPTSPPLDLRQPIYNRIKITYNAGDIKVYINNVLHLTGFYKISFPGYFGLTASTGGQTDRHSIRDFTLYTFKPIVSPPDAGPDKFVCSGDSVQLGVPPLPNDPYTYSWTPTDGMNNPAIPNPKVRLFNNLLDPVNYTYFVTKDSLVNDTLCAYSDAVQVTVYGKAAQAGPDVQLCSGESRTLGRTPGVGYTYSWSPATGLSDPDMANPDIMLFNNTNATQTFQYIVSATPSSIACTTYDTLNVTIYPKAAQAGPDVQFCSGESRKLGMTPVAGFTYSWSPVTGLNNPNSSEPIITLTNTTNATQTFQYLLKAFSGIGCTDVDTVLVTVAPGLVASAGSDLTVCSGGTVSIGTAPVNGVTYSWLPTTGLSNPNIANPQLTFRNPNQDTTVYQYVLTARNSFGCQSRDTVQVRYLPSFPVDAGNPVAFCSGETVSLGSSPQVGFTYSWFPTTGLDNPNSANPKLTLTSTTQLVIQYRLRVVSTALQCEDVDTVQVTVNPRPANPAIIGTRSVCPNVTGVVYRIRNAQAGVNYQWNVTGGTLKSGQGSGSIVIDWGPTGPTAGVSVTTSNAFGCVGKGASLTVTINKLLDTETPSSLQPDTLCLSQAAGVRYEVTNTTGSVYTWGVSGNGSLVSGQGTNGITVDWKNVGIGKVWLSEESTTLTDVCFGTSDTLYVRIVPLPDPNNSITGNQEVCEFATGQTYRLNGLEGSTYQWTVQGGTLEASNGDTATVSWGEAGSGKVLVKETTRFGCEGSTIELPVTLHPTPLPRIAASDSVICPQATEGLTYKVAGFAGSHFSWSLLNGQITSSNADSSVITVNWSPTSLPVQLSVVETSARGCVSTSLSFPLLYDATSIVIRSVSTLLSQEKDIVVSFRFPNAPALPNMFTLSRRTLLPSEGNWGVVATVSVNDTLYLDANLATDDQSYEYKLEGKNRCEGALSSTPHHSILLTGKGDEKMETVLLNWNAYTGWSEVKAYEVWRKLDEQSSSTLYETLDNDQLALSKVNATDGFQHCYRIRTVEKEGNGSVSWSNEVCLEFEHPLFIPNVITPNSDQQNDFWVIKNLELYPEHELTVVNRYGREIFKTNAYRQDWNGEGLLNGIYYYFLKTGRKNQRFRGWVQVLR